MLFGIVTHSHIGMCYNSVTVSGFGQLDHQFGRGEFCQQTVELIEQSGGVDGLSRSGRPQCTAGHLYLIAVGQQLKGPGIHHMTHCQKLCGHGAGADGGNGDAFRLQFLRRADGVGGNIGFRGGIHRHPGGGAEGGDGADVQDPAPLVHIGHRQIGDGSQRPEVQIDHPGLGNGVDLANVPQISASGVVHQQGDLRLFLHQMLLIGGKAHGVAQVQRQRQGADPLFLQLLCQFLKAVRPAGNEPHPFNFREYGIELPDKFPAKAGGRAGNNCCFHGQISFRSILVGLGSGILDALGIHPDGCHDHGLLGHIVHHVPLDTGNVNGHILTLGDLAEGGVLAVQMRSRSHHHKELAAGGVGCHGAGHGQHAGLVNQVILAEAVAGELAVDLIAGAAHAVSVGAAALDHEAGDDPVEGQAVIEALVSQRDEVVDGVGSLLGIQLAAHNAAVLHSDGYDGIAHIHSFLSDLLSAGLHGPVHFTGGVPLGGGVPLVVILLALAQADLHLHLGVLEIDAQGHQCVAVLLDESVELADLPLVHQQPPVPVRVPVEDVAMLVWRDVHAVDEQLAVLYSAVGVLQVHRARTDGFDLRAAQLDACLVLILHEVIVVGFAVLGRDFDSLFLRGDHLVSSESVYHSFPMTSRKTSPLQFNTPML